MPRNLAPRLAQWIARGRPHGTRPSAPGTRGTSASHPFLPDSFSAAAQLVEIAPGANLSASPDTWPWQDITGPQLVVWDPGITITCGQADEASAPTPADCTFTVRNDTGDFTRNNPLSRFYPYIKVDLPVRIRLDVGSGPSVQFQGYLSEIVPTWSDGTRLALVKLRARGILSRVQAGTKPLRSALYRAHTVAGSTAAAYWALEDAKNSVTAAGAIGGRDMFVVNTPASTFGFGNGAVSTGSTQPASDAVALPVYPSVGISYVNTFASPWTANTGWSVSWVAKIPQLPTGINSLIIEIFSTDSVSWEWNISLGTDGILRTSISDVNHVAQLSGSGAAFSSSLYGQWLLFTLTITPSGGTSTIRTSWSTASSTTTATDAYGTVPGQPNRIDVPATFASADNIPLGHLAIWPSPTPGITPSIAFGYIGENASTRFARLCTEENIPATVIGTSDITMGQQGIDTISSLLLECVVADGGLLSDGRGPGLLFVTQGALCDQPAQLSLDSTAGQLLGELDPTQDDLLAANAYTVSRKNGSSSTYVAPELATDTTIARRDSSLTVNTYDDTLLYSRASFEVTKQRVADFRYPSLAFAPAKSLALAQSWLDTQVGHRIDILHVPSLIPTYPPADIQLLLTGYTAHWNSRYWEVKLNTSLYAPYRGYVIEGSTADTRWRIDAGASSLAAEVLPGATTASVQSTDATLWSTSAGDYPRDVSIGGARVTVTAVAGGASPQTFTVAANAYRLPAGAKVSLWRPPTLRF